jgi:hypothetical protein
MKVVSLVCVCVMAAAHSLSGEERKAVPVYTNADLQRVSSLREETGVASRASSAGEPAARGTAPSRGPRRESEDYWRHEAERLRLRLEPLRDKADRLRLSIEERRRKPGVRPYSDPAIEAWQRQLQATLERIKEHEARFEERARRAGALPGWLR